MTRLRDYKITFRLTRNEYEIISWAAGTRGMNLSEYVRLCALERAGQALVAISLPQPVDSLSHRLEIDPDELDQFTHDADKL